MSVGVSPSEWVSAKRQALGAAGSLHARFTRGAFWSLTGAAISRGLTLVAAILCARLLGKVGFGELGIVQSTVGTFGILAGLGLGLTATKFVAEFRERDPLKVGRILALTTVAALGCSATMAFLLIVLAPYLAGNTLGAPQLATPLAVGAGLVFFGALNGAQTGALAGFEAFRKIAYVNIGVGVASFPTIVVGVWRWGVTGAIWGMVAAMILNWILNHRALRQECSRTGIFYDFARCQREWRVLVEFSLPAFLASVVVGPALWVCNTLLVRQPNGYAQLGLYTAADRWRLLILFVPGSLFGMVLPVLSSLYGSADEMGFHRFFRTNLLLNLGLALVPAVAIATLALPIMSLYGRQFRAGWAILIVLALAAIPEAISTIYMVRLICADRMWWRLALDLQLVVVLLLLARWWIPRWGALGMAAAYGSTMVALCLSQSLLTGRQLASGCNLLAPGEGK